MKRRLLFVVNVDWFFLSHRLPIAVAARDAGFDVAVAAGETAAAEQIRTAGFEFVPLPLTRSQTSLRGEITAFRRIRELYRTFRPHIVHHVTLKPVIYGSLAARGMKETAVVNALTGLGYTFIDPTRSRMVSAAVRVLASRALTHPRSRTIFQNPDDRGEFVGRGWVPENRTVLIQGSGVDCKEFLPSAEPAGPPVIMLPARLLRDKGVVEFVEAARLVREAGLSARFVLVGRPDPENPASVDPQSVEQWVSTGIVEAWGHSSDMPRTLAQSTVVVLPSYREGLPKVLLEAAASGKPIITTDVPGCRHAVLHERTGLLVPPRDSRALADAVIRLLEDADTRLRMGLAGRQMVESGFSVEHVVAKTLALYECLSATTRGVRG